MPEVITSKKKTSLDPASFAISKENRERKKKLQADYQAVSAVIDKERRKATAEEQEKLDKMYADVVICDENIDRAEKMTVDIGDDSALEEATRRAEHAEKELEQRKATPPSLPSDSGKFKLTYHGETAEENAIRERRTKQEYLQVAKDYLTPGGGKAALQPHIAKRNLQADIDYKGGYLVMPEQLSNRILKAVDDIIWLSKFATTTKLLNAQSLGIPTLEANPEDSDWTTEIATVDEDTAMTFGKRVLQPHPFRKLIKVSERWLRMAANATFDSADDQNGKGGRPQDIVINRLAYKTAITKEKALHTGSGVGRPLGMYTASAVGISTARDVAVAASNALTYPLLLAAKWSLKVQYHKTARWEFSRSMMQKLMGMVDTAGRPLLNFQTFPDTPAMLLGHPIELSEFVPTTFTTGAYIGMLADYSFYHVADSLEFWIRMAEELYLETMQIGFFTSAETDGMPVLEEAFVRMKWAT